MTPQALLGSILDGGASPSAAIGHKYADPKEQAVADAIISLYVNGQVVDALTVRQKLKDGGHDTSVLSDLLDASANHYLESGDYPSISGENAVQGKSGSCLHVLNGCDIIPEAITWLWPGWLAKNKFHILAGAAGTGKTTIAINQAATLTRGGLWPDGTRAPVGDALIWSGEDDPSDTLAPRFLAANANMQRIHFIAGVSTSESPRPFDPAIDLPYLREYLTLHPEIKLLIVDPVVSAVSGDSHKNTEVRRALQPLADLDCAVLGITHFSKGTTGRDPLERVTGSIAFGALARIVLATCKMEGADLPEGTRLFARSKSNIGPDTGGFTYRLEQTMLEAFPDVAASAVLWGEAVEGTARELMAEADGGDDEGGAALTDAKDFLTEELRSGAVSAKKLISEARRHGISERTLKRAKAALKIKSEKKVDSWFWQFTNQVGHEGCHSKSLASLASLASLDDPQTLINTEGCQECQEIQSGTGGTLDGNLEVIEW